MSSFDRKEVDTPLVPGSIRGIREFKVDYNETQGTATLGPVFAHFAYDDGENVANCDHTARSSMRGGTEPIWGRHQPVPDKLCSCGFYAYWQDAELHDVTSMGFYDKVVGIIDAYGKCLVGNQGFRAQKAKVVALVLPDLPGEDEPGGSWHKRFRNFMRKECIATHRWMSKSRSFLALILMYMVPALGLGLLGLVGGTVGAIVQGLLLILQFAFCSVFVIGAAGNYFILKNTIRSLDPSGRYMPNPDANMALRNAYPSAQFFPTIEKALEALPAMAPKELL